jgi:hypothetical protein
MLTQNVHLLCQLVIRHLLSHRPGECDGEHIAGDRPLRPSSTRLALLGHMPQLVRE